MAFWENSPTETTPLSASNLSRMEKYTTATSSSNGDFYVTINNSSGLATGDIVKITFPSATLNTANARLSIDGGTTYKNIFSKYQLLARAVENKDIELMFDGTQFIAITEISEISSGVHMRKSADGFVNIWGSASLTGLTGVYSSSSEVYFTSAVITLPTGFNLNISDYEVQLNIKSSGIYQTSLLSVTSSSITVYVSANAVFNNISITELFDIKTQY